MLIWDIQHYAHARAQSLSQIPWSDATSSSVIKTQLNHQNYNRDSQIIPVLLVTLLSVI